MVKEQDLQLTRTVAKAGGCLSTSQCAWWEHQILARWHRTCSNGLSGELQSCLICDHPLFQTPQYNLHKTALVNCEWNKDLYMQKLRPNNLGVLRINYKGSFKKEQNFEWKTEQNIHNKKQGSKHKTKEIWKLITTATLIDSSSPKFNNKEF